MTEEDKLLARQVSELRDFGKEAIIQSSANLIDRQHEIIRDLEKQIDKLKSVIAEANNSLYGSHGFFLSLDGSEGDKYHLSRGIENLKEESNKRYRETEELKSVRDRYDNIIDGMLDTMETMEAEIETAKLEERLACAKVASEGSWAFPIEVWHNATKKEMTELTALTIAKAILDRK